MDALKKEILAQVDIKIKVAIEEYAKCHPPCTHECPPPCEHDCLSMEEIIANLPPIYIPADAGTIEVRLGDELPPMRFIVTTEKGIPTQKPVTKHLSELVTIRLVPRDLSGPTAQNPPEANDGR